MAVSYVANVNGVEVSFPAAAVKAMSPEAIIALGIIIPVEASVKIGKTRYVGELSAEEYASITEFVVGLGLKVAVDKVQGKVSESSAVRAWARNNGLGELATVTKDVREAFRGLSESEQELAYVQAEIVAEDQESVTTE